MGRVAKGEKCSVVGCDNLAVRSLSNEKISSSGLKVNEVKRVYLCKDHYKEYRKSPKIKQAKKIEKWRYRT